MPPLVHKHAYAGRSTQILQLPKIIYYNNTVNTHHAKNYDESHFENKC